MSYQRHADTAGTDDVMLTGKDAAAIGANDSGGEGSGAGDGRNDSNASSFVADTPIASRHAVSTNPGGTCGKCSYVSAFVAVGIVIVALIAAVVIAGGPSTSKNSSVDVQACVRQHQPDTLMQEGRGNQQLGLPNGGSAPEYILLKHCTVWTGSMVAGQQELPDTDILLHGTKIEQVGAGLVAPAGAQVIDAQHRVCTPGIVDMHSHAGVYGWPEVWAREDGNEMTNPAFPQVRAIDAYDPIDSAIPLILGGGVTTSQILPGSGNTMGGEGFIVKMRGHTVRDAYYPGSPRFLKHALGENPKRVYGSKDVTPMSRMGSAWIMRQKYEQAAKLIAAQEAWCLDPHTRRGADRAGEYYLDQESREPFPTDLSLDSLTALLRGEARLHVHGYEIQDLEMIMRLSREFNFTISAFHHALEAYMIPDLVKESGATVATFSDLWGYKMEAYDASTRSPSILNDASVPVALKSDHPVLFSKDMMLEAAKAHYYGLPRFTAIAAITSRPATAMGMDEHVGMIAPGMDGDVVVWDRDPLTLGATPNMVFVNSELLVNRNIDKVDHPTSEPRTPAQLTTSGGPVCMAGAANIAITGVTVYHQDPDAASPMTAATILITNGVVTCMGAGAACTVPAGASVYNLDGGFVTPGFIESLSHIGQIEIESESSTNDGSISGPGTDGSSAAVMAYDGIRMNTRHTDSAFKAGVTTSVSHPVGSQLMAGLSVAFHTYGATVHDALVHPHAALHVNVGQHAKRGGSTNSISGQFYALRQLFRHVNASEPNPFAPNDIIAMVKNKLIPLVVHVDQADAIAAALRFKHTCDCNMVIAGAAEAHVIAADIKAAGVSVLLKSRVPPRDFQTLRSVEDSLKLLKDAGVKTALAIGDVDDARNLRWEAGIAQARGLSFDQALASITTDVADVFGLPSHLGRIKVGHKANLVVFDGAPLTLQGRPTMVVLGDYVDCALEQR